eukprot:10003526-Heterocapsa_arctica.AAC.1
MASRGAMSAGQPYRRLCLRLHFSAFAVPPFLLPSFPFQPSLHLLRCLSPNYPAASHAARPQAT